MSDPTKVDFYLLKDDNHRQVLQFCARLVEKAWKLGNKILILTGSRKESETIDELLWTYNQNSFLPHSIVDQNIEAPIQINHETTGDRFDLMINLSNTLPDDAVIYPRIAEVISADEQIKNEGRARYSGYKKLGFDVNHHEIG